MTDAERMGTAITLALFFHFLIVLYKPAEPDPPVLMRLEVATDESSTISKERLGEGTGISTAPTPDTPENEQRNKKRQAWLEYLDGVDAAIHARRLFTGREDLIGTTLCAFTILPDGHFTNARIIRSSGNPDLDRDALTAIAAASGVVKRPAIIGNERLEISLWIKYQYGLN